MGELDHGAKLALRADPLGVIGHVLAGVTAASPWPQETISAQRTVDGSYQATIDGAPAVVHVEFEAEPSSDSGARAVEHALVLYVALRRRVRVVVFYLHPASDGRRPLDRHALPIGEEPAAIVFRPVALWDLDPEVALDGPVGLLPFVPLMRDASLGQVRRAVDRSARRASTSGPATTSSPRPTCSAHTTLHRPPWRPSSPGRSSCSPPATRRWSARRARPCTRRSRARR